MIVHLVAKEVLSTLRDTRAVLANLLIPLIVLPVVMLGLPLVFGGLFAREAVTVTEVAVSGLEFLPTELRDQLEAEALALIETDDPLEQVDDDLFPLALTVPPDFAAQLANNQAELTLHYKLGNLRSGLAASKVQRAINSFRDTRTRATLDAAGVDAAILTAVRINEQDVSSEAEQRSGMMAWLIPFLMVIWTLSGGQMTAIDATAGEKERGSLETVLVTPVRRRDLVTAKFLATTLFGVSSALMAIVGYFVSSRFLMSGLVSNLMGGSSDAQAMMGMMGGQLSLSPSAFLLLTLSSLVVAMMVAALLICVAMLARSYKEAQSYIAPLGLVMILPVVGLQVADFLTLGLGFYAVPLLNAMLLMTDIIRADANLAAMFVTWGSSLFYCAILLAIANHNFNREDVLFRT
ncbi:MAG: ABC transporter permease subunit [Deinococcota bacterium]